MSTKPGEMDPENNAGKNKTASDKGHVAETYITIVPNLPNLGLQLVNKIPGFCVFCTG